MTRDSKHYPDDEPNPFSAWRLLNCTGKPPTWEQLERGAAARRRENLMSHTMEQVKRRKSGGDNEIGSNWKGRNVEDAGACAE